MVPKNILVSDDEPPICELLKITIEKEGHRVFTAFNGKEALKIVQSNSVDVAILDIKMPQLGGVEVLKKIKAINPDIEVIIITGFADLETLRQTMDEYGAFDYLLKPFKGEDIIPILKSALLRREIFSRKRDLKGTEDEIVQLEKNFIERTRKLRESQIKYKEIIESSNDIILIVQDGKVTYANRKTREITGYSENEILGLPFIELVVPEDHNLVSYKSSSTYSFRMRKKGGGDFLAEVNEVNTVWEDRPAVLKFIRDISERIQAEQHIRVLSQQLIKAQEVERQKLSCELHDRLAQDLSTLKLGLDNLFSEFRDSGVYNEIKKRISELSRMLKGAIMTVRDLAYDLRPPSLGYLGIVQTFKGYCEEFEEKTSINIEFYSAGIEKLKLNPDIEINLYRLLQEAFNNIKKHAQATLVKVRLTASFPNIILIIEDNGKGFDVEKCLQRAGLEKKMGLRSMEERVALLRGKIRIQSQLHQGTKIFIEVPYTNNTIKR